MSEHISIAVLVPFYCTPPVPYSKAKAVKLIAQLRLSSRNARGKGSRAARRARQMSRVHSLPLGIPKWM